MESMKRVCRILLAFVNRKESNKLSVKSCHICEDCQELQKGLDYVYDIVFGSNVQCSRETLLDTEKDDNEDSLSPEDENVWGPRWTVSLEYVHKRF